MTTAASSSPTAPSSTPTAKPAEKLFSVDSHVFFTDDWVTARLPERLRQKYIDGNKDFQKASLAKRGGWTPDIVDLFDPEAWNDPGHYEPNAKLKSMDRDGVYAEVIFPEVSGTRVCTPEVMGDDWKPMLSGFNEAMADFASVNPDRLMCAYQLLPFDIEASILELERVAKRGARCFQLPPFPSELGLKEYFDRSYDPLWARLQEMGLTVLQHLDTTEKSYEQMRRDPTPQRAVALGLTSMQLAEPLSFWILSGTLERFPKLKVIFVEPGLGWLPFLFDTVLDGRILQGHYKFPQLTMLPSEYFKRQMGATFMYEPVGLKAAYEYFGPDVLFWSTDFPHPATSWPNSRALIEKQFSAAGISGEDRHKILCANGERMFAHRN